MNFGMILRVAFRALLRNKTRSVLTCTGIIVGIASVIAVQAIGQGAAAMMRAEIEKIGQNFMVVLPDATAANGVSGGSGQGETLTVDDGEAIRDQLKHLVMAVTPIIECRSQLVRENRNWNARVQGVSHEYQTVRKQELCDGRFFDSGDQRLGKCVCVIGVTVRERLFPPNVDPLGKMIRIGAIPFTVIGVLTPSGSNAFGGDQDDAVLVPYTTAIRVLERPATVLRSVNLIQMLLWHPEYLDDARNEISKLLRQRHSLSADKRADFKVLDNRENFAMINRVLLIITILLTLCAGLSLFIGGVGIMNIMLVSVAERTKEIGLRVAIGARPAAILGQFVLEAVVLAVGGGVIGVLAGVGMATLICHIQHWPMLVEASSVVVSFLFALLVGVTFGFFPARRAARLSPMECLRYE